MNKLSALKRMMVSVLPAMLMLGLNACGTSGMSNPDDSSPTPGNVVIPKTNTKDETEQRRRARLRLELGISYYQQRKYAIALEELKQSTEIDSNYPDPYSVLGLTYMDLGDKRQAEEAFQKGLSLDRNHSDLNLNYGWFLCQNGREKESIPRFVAVARNPLYSAPVKPLQNAGICAIKMNDRKMGEQFLMAAYDTDPNSPVALYHLANFNLQKADLTKARFFINRLHSLYEKTAQTLWLNIKIERAANAADKVAELSKQLRENFPVSPEADSLSRGAYNE